MNIKDFNSVEMLVPIQYMNKDGIQTQAVASVSVVRGRETVITIPGDKHSTAFMEMILLQVLTGFTVNQQEPQSGIPGHNVEVTACCDESPRMVCSKHQPIQHRDAKEPWCDDCMLNKDFNPPRQIAFGNRPSQFRESQKVFEEGEGREGTR